MIAHYLVTIYGFHYLRQCICKSVVNDVFFSSSGVVQDPYDVLALERIRET
jgi:hypothetical protein